jgi:hypothetical protein
MQSIAAVLARGGLAADPARQRSPMHPEGLGQLVVIQPEIGLKLPNRRYEADVNPHDPPVRRAPHPCQSLSSCWWRLIPEP